MGGTLDVTGNQTNSGNLTISGAFTSQGIDDNADATAITITSAEEIGIGTSSPTSSSGGKLLAIETTADEHTNLVFNTANTDKNGIIEARRTGRSGAERFAQLNLQNNSDGGEMRFYTAPSGSDISEAMRVDNNGALLISRTDQTVNSSNFGAVLVAGNLNTAKNTDGSGVVVQVYGNAGKAFIYGDGDIGNDNGTYSSFSDQSLKENIVDAQSQWTDIKAVQVRNFNLIANPNLKQIGVVAQELEASNMGGLVEEKEHDNEGNKKKTVKLSVLHMKALKALQEAMTRIETLETENKTQTTQIADLISRVTALENAE
jgi:hypothetical protein